MKALICSLNSKYIHSSLAPWCLAGGIEEYTTDVEYDVLECTINESFEDVCKKISSIDFDIIGFCTYIWNVNYVEKLCEYVKSVKQAVVVLGGPEAGYNVESFLKKEYVDYVITGEGEEPFAKLCQGIRAENISGVSYKEEGKMIISKPKSYASDPPLPYVKKYFERLNGRIAYIESSRGCPYNCAFCLSGRCEGVRFFDIERTKESILKLANSGTQTVKFVDRTFNANKKRAIEIFKFIIDNYGKTIPQGVRFHFEIESTLVDEETISVLKKAPIGSMQLEIGLQSFNEKTLAHINRKRDITKTKKVVKKLISLGNLHIHIDLIIGLPYEDMTSFEQSFNEAYRLKAHMLQLGFLKLLHGSDMRENPGKYPCEYSLDAPYEVESTPWISGKEIANLHTCEDIFEKMYNSGRFRRTCEYLTSICESPFKMYYDFSQIFISNNVPKTLDVLTQQIWNYFSNQQSINKMKLRDLLAMDRLSTNRMGVLPDFLKIKSEKIKSILNELDKDETTRRKKGVKRAIAILSSNDEYVYVDYCDANPITGEYLLHFGKIGNI